MTEMQTMRLLQLHVVCVPIAASGLVLRALLPHDVSTSMLTAASELCRHCGNGGDARLAQGRQPIIE